MMMLADTAALADRYRGFCGDEGRPPLVCVTRNAWVGQTRADVERDWYGAAVDFHLGYRKAGYVTPDPNGIYNRLERGEQVSLAEFAEDRAIAGTPEDCVAQLARWRDAGGTNAMLMLLNEEAGYDKMLAAIELFGREVFPALAATS
jgi:alkanesulfonate monooxygenase SsuD/methylene tetrahydromethanopterin reductase-like flavin-dependent oxidoreductase (luciferase family)